jgi:hypothetical protein
MRLIPCETEGINSKTKKKKKRNPNNVVNHSPRDLSRRVALIENARNNAKNIKAEA